MPILSQTINKSGEWKIEITRIVHYCPLNVRALNRELNVRGDHAVADRRRRQLGDLGCQVRIEGCSGPTHLLEWAFLLGMALAVTISEAPASIMPRQPT